jgi:hypothetical protein
MAAGQGAEAVHDGPTEAEVCVADENVGRALEGQIFDGEVLEGQILEGQVFEG